LAADPKEMAAKIAALQLAWRMMFAAGAE